MSKQPANTKPDLVFETALAQVESIIEKIETGEIGLEASLAEYERGVELIRHCRSALGRAQQRVEDLTKKLETADTNGSPNPPRKPGNGAEPGDEGDSGGGGEPPF